MMGFSASFAVALVYAELPRPDTIHNDAKMS